MTKMLTVITFCCYIYLVFQNWPTKGSSNCIMHYNHISINRLKLNDFKRLLFTQFTKWMEDKHRLFISLFIHCIHLIVALEIIFAVSSMQPNNNGQVSHIASVSVLLFNRSTHKWAQIVLRK